MASIARRAISVARIASARTSSHAASIGHRRSLASTVDNHGSPRVNCWQDPMNLSKWKEEHVVLVSLSGWALLFYSGCKYFIQGKEDEIASEFKYEDKDFDSDEKMWDLYERWSKHHMVSRSLEEMQKRFNTFKHNVKYIYEANKEGRPYKLSLNKFADLTNDEFGKMYLMGTYKRDKR